MKVTRDDSEETSTGRAEMSVDDCHYGMEREEKAEVAEIEGELLVDEGGILNKQLGTCDGHSL